MKVKEKIEKKLKGELSFSYLSVVDESHLHRPGLTSQSHYQVVIVSEHFEEMSLLMRHRLIYQLLENIHQEGVHALSLHLYTPTEWKTLKPKAKTPPCINIIH